MEGENRRAAGLISEAGVVGLERGEVGGLTCFVLRGQKIGRRPVVSLAQPTSDYAGGGERTS